MPIFEYINVLFDGLAFFGFDEVKLNRLKGIPPKWTDRFFTKEWLLRNLILFSIFVFIMNQTVSEFGSLKSA